MKGIHTTLGGLGIVEDEQGTRTGRAALVLESLFFRPLGNEVGLGRGAQAPENVALKCGCAAHLLILVPMPTLPRIHPLPLSPNEAADVLARLHAAGADGRALPAGAVPPPAPWGVIPAAGVGARSGLPMPKQYAGLGAEGLPMLAHTIAALAQAPGMAGIVVVLSPAEGQDDGPYTRARVADALVKLNVGLPVLPVLCGGSSRGRSVLGAAELFVAAGLAHTPLWVHDAARPWVPRECLDALGAAWSQRSAPGIPLNGHADVVADCMVLGLPVLETLHSASPDRAAPSRDGLWSAQTPQIAMAEHLQRALTRMPEATDEATALRAQGHRLGFVVGHPINRKLTLPQDFADSVPMTSSSNIPLPPVRMGTGYDVHALVEGRPLVLGGVTIPHTHGLLGHSDADALLHAIADALLGAAGLGDIGRHFPDTDPQYAGADSRVLLRSVVERVRAQGLVPAQVDATIIAQAPKLSPHIDRMVANIQEDLGTPWVNVKATTTEHLGFTGRREGIAAEAVAVLVPHSVPNAAGAR